MSLGMIAAMLKILGPVGLLIVVTTACSGAAGQVERDGFVVEREAIDEDEIQVRKRASFDLTCEKSSLKLRVLAVHDDAGADMPTNIGVEGCGKRATYRRQIAESQMLGTGRSFTTLGAWELEMVSKSEEDETPTGRSTHAAGAEHAIETSQEAVTAAPRSEGDPPVGVAGFQFQMSALQAQLACEGAGNQWVVDSVGSSCSGPAESIGMDASVQLQSCGDAFCQILITSEPSEQELVPRVLALKEALEQRYGTASDSNTSVPQDCLKTVAKCVDEQRVYLEYLWKFESGEKIKLRIGKAPDNNSKSSGTDHKLRLLYRRPVPAKPKMSTKDLAL